MSEDISRTAQLLIDEFPDSSIGIIGCHSNGENYHSCELDYLVISCEDGFERRLVNNSFVDILFVSKESLQANRSNKLSLSLLDMTVISDPSWVLNPLVSTVKGNSSKYRDVFAKEKVFNALSDISRFEESLQSNHYLEADFWLKSSAYNLASALIAQQGEVPRISHILSEFRNQASSYEDLFQSWVEALGLNLATDISVARRLEAFRELVLSNSSFPDTQTFYSPNLTYKLAEKRAKSLINLHLITEAYCYLGFELIISIKDLYDYNCNVLEKAPEYPYILSSFKKKDQSNKLLSVQTIKLLDLNVEEHNLNKLGSHFKTIIRSYAKEISKENIYSK